MLLLTYQAPPCSTDFQIAAGGEEQKQALLERFAPEQLPVEFGGTAATVLGYRERGIKAYERSGGSAAGRVVGRAGDTTLPPRKSWEGVSEREGEKEEERAREAVAGCHGWYGGVDEALSQLEW